MTQKESSIFVVIPKGDLFGAGKDVERGTQRLTLTLMCMWLVDTGRLAREALLGTRNQTKGGNNPRG